MRKTLFPFILALLSLASFGQTVYDIYWIGTDTLVSGDSAKIDLISNYDGWAEGFTCRLVVSEPYYNNDLIIDTVYAYRFVKTNDSLHTAYFVLPENTKAGSAYIEFYSPGFDEWGYSESIIPVGSKPVIIHDLYDTILCGEETFFYGVSVFSPDWPTAVWYHDGLVMEQWTDTGIYVHEADYVDTGTYYCVLTNRWGSVTSKSGRISFPQLGYNLGKPLGISQMCKANDSSNYSIPGDPRITFYSWTLLPQDAGELEYQDTSATIFWDKNFAGQAKLLVKTQIGECKGQYSDTLKIGVAGPGESPEICIVGVDPVSGKNLIVWEKPPGAESHTFILHRETNQADIYLPLATIEPGDPSIYIDTTSTPELVSQRYKLSLIDTCGFESELSAAHKTIHLTNNMAANGNVNLIWDGYEGFPFLSYTIYHGPHTDSMEYVNTVPSNVFIYSNIEPFPGDNFFQTEAIRPEGCTPSLKSVNYGSSRSNILYVETETGFDEMQTDPDRLITVYPTYAPGSVTLKIPGFNQPVPAKLHNISGQLVREFVIDSGSVNLDVSSLPEGMYIITLIQGETALQAKIVKSR